ncbi:hypothetical protein DFJ43DRAFT_604152 [Lentinula guzmanii]|uniref:Uncharacterized protein n=1 Tax=Lentinula guzmanii TaxID=2804957 RepID=A0AA38N3R5_9AGAR|nr:hypothetical protein DFJ43DRAFT_604152 [Lentinula guzmanii]
MDESTSSTHRICSTKKCKTVLPPESIDKAKTCTTCREKDRLRKQTKRATEKRQREEQEHPPSRAAPKKPADNLSGYGNPFNDDSDAEEFSNPSLQYRNADEMFLALKKASEKIHISFHGQYIMPSDPLVTDRERVRMATNEIWKITGFRFTVRDHPKMATGHKTRLCTELA